MTPRLSLACLALVLAGCSSHPHGVPGGPGGGPGGPRGPSPIQSETTAALDCRIKPYAVPDGSVSRDALDKGLRGAFAAADGNRDGVLEKAEITALNAARAGGCDSEPVIDWDGGGRMTYTAFAARTFTLFDRADADSDGILTAEEMKQAGRPARGGHGDPPPGGAQGPSGPPQ